MGWISSYLHYWALELCIVKYLIDMQLSMGLIRASILCSTAHLCLCLVHVCMMHSQCNAVFWPIGAATAPLIIVFETWNSTKFLPLQWLALLCNKSQITLHFQNSDVFTMFMIHIGHLIIYCRSINYSFCQFEAETWNY